MLRLQFKDKKDLIHFVNHQVNVILEDKNMLTLENALYTEINRKNKNTVLGLLLKYHIRYESHKYDNYWIFFK